MPPKKPSRSRIKKSPLRAKKPAKAASPDVLERIAAALERLAPLPVETVSLTGADAFVWQAETERLVPVAAVNRVPLRLLKGIEHQSALLLANTQQHADGFPANNALLWGARGTGKSSLVKAVHAEINTKRASGARLALVEIHREDIDSLPSLLARLRTTERQCVLFCDDLSFEGDDQSYKALKAVLEGGLEGRPANVVFYATSNRRHMMARDMIENERATAIHASEATEEKVSLSDRFGLWLGFHNLDQDTFLSIVSSYAKAFDIPMSADKLHARAIEWSMTRGARSGRVAWQLIQALAGEKKVRISHSE